MASGIPDVSQHEGTAMTTMSPEPNPEPRLLGADQDLADDDEQLPADSDAQPIGPTTPGTSEPPLSEEDATQS
jgi:hypothetical protein